jgi:hypothetical protein
MCKKHFIGKSILFAIWIFSSMFLWSCDNVLASGVQMSQSILPVKFVYLDKHNKISDIWTNVAENDNQYVLKFVRPDGKEDVVANSELVALFVKKNQNSVSCSDVADVRFLQNNEGLEEVRTYS